MYALLDIGGTKTRIAVSGDLETFNDPVIIPTPKVFDEGISEITRVVSELAGDAQVKVVAAGVAASPNREKTMLVSGGPNIMDWLNKPLKDRLEESIGAPVYIENDTAMGGLAQVMYGPAQGYEIAVYVTVSTGVGGCRFVQGRIDMGAMGFEPGWQIIGNPELCKESEGEWMSGYCSAGYLISHIGGACVERREGKKPYEITDEEFWDKEAKFLAYGLHNVCTMWSPDIIVIGGSMVNEVGISISKTKEHLARTMRDVFPNSMPQIEHASFGDEMGLHGAMAYIKQKM